MIQPGDAGIWATCAMNKEAKSVADLRDLFGEVSLHLRRDWFPACGHIDSR